MRCNKVAYDAVFVFIAPRYSYEGLSDRLLMVFTSKDPAFNTVPLMSELEYVAGRVIAIANDNQVLASGSCVRIAPGLYLTAAHVMQDFLHNFGDTEKHCNFTVWIVHLHAGPVMEIWALDRMWLPGNTDVAVLHAVPYTLETMNLKGLSCVGIDLAPPIIGSRIFGFGFHSSKGKVSIDGDDRFNLDIWGEPAIAIGEIRDVHPQSRDSYLLNYPCFQVNARFDGGMSGGPIFSESGNVCGIISTNVSLHAQDQECISYGATLWPIMGMPLDIDMRTGLHCERYSFVDLAKQGVVHIEDVAAISAKLLSGGPDFSATYNPTTIKRGN